MPASETPVPESSAKSNSPHLPRLGPIDYDLNGVVGIRLLDATASDARAVARQLGSLRNTLDRAPDIVIRFVDSLTLASPLRYLGRDTAGFTDDAFLVLRGRHKARTRVSIPFDQVGGRCEIVCESGLPAVPLLIAIVNLTALARGVAPLHASAFEFGDTGVLVTGWSKGGKTEALLAFMARGASYLGDEWVYVDPAARQMFGIPQPIRLWDWHLAQLPRYAARIGWAKRTRLRAIEAAMAVGRDFGGDTPAPAWSRLHALIERQACVDVAPERLFGPVGSRRAPVDRLFLLASHAGPDVVVAPFDPLEIAERVVYSVLYELAPLTSYYDMARFASPSLVNDHIDRLEGRLRAAFRRALAGCPAYAVYHPYPMRVEALFDAMRPHL